MVKLIVICAIILLLAVVMTMAGRGGGNFYVLLLVITGIPMHQAATTGQFILFTTALSAFFVFQKNKAVVWPLAILIGSLTASAAFAGGYFSHWFSGFTLKMVFSGLLAIAGGLMLLPIKERCEDGTKKGFGYWRFESGGQTYTVNLWVAVSVTLSAGFGSGMVGVSGGSFLVPLMVLTCGVPMRAAVGTASTLIASTALMGFIGHTIQGDFSPALAIPLAAVTVVGGFIGGKFAMKTRPKHLKLLFAYTTLLAALFMVINAFYSRIS